MFAFEDDTNNFVEYTNLTPGKFEFIKKASLLVQRSLPSLANFEDKHIFITGGHRPNLNASLVGR